MLKPSLPPNGITVTLRDYVTSIVDERDRRYDDRFKSVEANAATAVAVQEKLTNAAFAASEKAIAKSDINAERWRENANEWRAAMQDRETRFAARTEVEAEFKNLRLDITGLKALLDDYEGRRAGMQAFFGYIVAAIAALVGLVAVFYRFTVH